jgi:hypothetical protein
MGMSSLCTRGSPSLILLGDRLHHVSVPCLQCTLVAVISPPLFWRSDSLQEWNIEEWLC